MNKKILIACPVRDREWILPYYLDCLYNLDYPKKYISILWVLNESKDKSEELLKQFKKDFGHEYRNIIIEKFKSEEKIPVYDRKVRNKVEIDKQGNKKIVYDDSMQKVYTHLTKLRNYIIGKIGDNDYLFSSDSDITFQNNILNKLISHKKDIVSSLIYNGYLVNNLEPWKYPNILKVHQDGKIEHIANVHVKNAPCSSSGKLLSVDVTGACYLLSKEVCKTVQYSYHYQGEDVGFCLEAKNKGFNIFCDTGCFSHHIMSKELLKNHLNYWEKL